jgi:hypothetical protein
MLYKKIYKQTFQYKEMKGLKWVVIISLVVFVLVVGAAFFLYSYSRGGDKSSSNATQIVLVNPAFGMSEEKAIQQFNESFVSYLLYSIKANELHSLPWPKNKDLPKIQFYLDTGDYNAIVDGNLIKVSKGKIDEEDIIIRTTKREAVKMLMSSSHVQDSFLSGASKVEMTASKPTLFLKGYLKLYEDLTGRKII